MNRSLWTAPLALWLLSACGEPLSPEQDMAVSAPITVTSSAKLLRSSEAVPGQYIVVLDDAAPGLSAQRVPEIAAQLMARHGGSVERTYSHALRGFAARMSEAQALALAQDSSVKYIEEDARTQAISTTDTGVPYHLDRIDQRDLPLSGSYSYYVADYTTAAVHAYVLDTGIRTTHNQFSGRATMDFSAVSGKGASGDCHGHGTHVAGTVGGSSLGVARGISLHGVRIIGCDGTGTVSEALAGVDWVTANHIKPAVANMSVQYPAAQALDDAIRASINAGVTYVVAANNFNSDSCLRSPSRVLEAITVGATNEYDERADFSSWGPCVDLFAPGVSVLSAYNASDTGLLYMSGTSMATPHVTGAVARYLQIFPEATPAAVAEHLLSQATVGKVINPGTGSPNRLLYTDFLGLALQSGRSNAPGWTHPAGQSRFFSLKIPAGLTRLDVMLNVGSGASGDADVFIRHGAPPTLSTYDCRTAQAGPFKRCTLNNVQPGGTYYVMLYGNTDYAYVSLLPIASIPLQNGVPVSGLSGSTSQSPYFTVDVPAGTTELHAETYGGTGDFLFGVQRDINVPTLWPYTVYDCSSGNYGTNTEGCTVTSPVPTTYFISFYSSWYFESYSGVTIQATYH